MTTSPRLRPSQLHYLPKVTQKTLDRYAREYLYYRECEMNEVFDVVEGFISLFTRYRFDMDIAAKRINEIWSKKLSAPSAIKYAYTHLTHDWAGGCFNFSSALAYRLWRASSRENCRCLRNVAIVLSPTPDGRKKCSVAYQNGGKLFVADPIELIEGHVKEIRAISQIPYDQFAGKYGQENVLLFDIDLIEGPYVEALQASSSNTTPEEFLRKE